TSSATVLAVILTTALAFAVPATAASPDAAPQQGAQHHRAPHQVAPHQVAPPEAAASGAAGPVTPVGPTTAAAPAGPATIHRGQPKTITLFTGDRRLVAPDGRSVTTLPTPGRETARLLTQRIGGRLSVIPTDALTLINAGRVDRRLFDITTLIEDGYEDSSGKLPLIITYEGGAAGERTVRNTASAARADVVHDLPSIDGFAVKADPANLGGLWNSLTEPTAAVGNRAVRAEIGRIGLDGRRRILLDSSVPQVNAPAAWAAGYTGAGVSVGLVDSGVDETHPDLAGRVVSRDFTGAGDTRDYVGHGTHVASTIAGTGAASNGRYRGVAPGAKIYSAKACGFFCNDSDIVAAMQWLSTDVKVPVVNLSLGTPDEPGLDDLERAVGDLSAANGTLFVVAAGNSGEQGATVASPASADNALAVGSVSKRSAGGQSPGGSNSGGPGSGGEERYSPFSNPGPRLGDGILKPEIAAPGENITAARSADSFGESGPYVTMSGTSMATPHVTGAAAILAQQHPDWKYPQFKAALMGSAVPVDKANVFQTGAGRLDVGRAVTQTVTTAPPGITLGQHRDPEDAAARPSTQTVVYRNAGTAAVTLNLAVDARDPKNQPAPAGMFTLGATRLTVPAGGQASVLITGDARLATRAGVYGGSLVATDAAANGSVGAGTPLVRTPVGLEKLPQEFELTVNNVNRQGRPTDQARVIIAGLDNGYLEAVADVDADSIQRRLPKGRYLVTSTIVDPGPRREVTSLTQPDLVLDRDMALDLDARLGKPVSVDVTKRDAVMVAGFFNITATVDSGSLLGFGVGGPSFADLYSANLGGGAADHVSTQLSAHFAQRQADGGTVDSPWTIAVGLRESGRILDGYHRTVRDDELATVENRFAAVATRKSDVTKVNTAVWPDSGPDDWAGSTTVDLPGRRTDYYASEGGVTWKADVFHEVAGAQEEFPDVPAYLNSFSQPAQAYVAGRTYHESWNTGVFGPAFVTPGPGESGLNRTANTFDLEPTLYSDDHGRSASSTTVAAFMRLSRDRDVIYEGEGQAGGFDVPAADG
ncbi:MAG: hypothetical protein QOE03_1012, partial [Micromonosporaceae bacterium]|nr:hypothetical protein [Micromonosporaceae bacterium]